MGLLAQVCSAWLCKAPQASPSPGPTLKTTLETTLDRVREKDRVKEAGGAESETKEKQKENGEEPRDPLAQQRPIKHMSRAWRGHQAPPEPPLPWDSPARALNVLPRGLFNHTARNISA